jgi:hypothetical protein
MILFNAYLYPCSTEILLKKSRSLNLETSIVNGLQKILLGGKTTPHYLMYILATFVL